MPQDRLFRAGSPVPARLPGDDCEPWTVAADRRIRVGTASWTDKTLIESGLFYPPEVKSPADRLRYYAEAFPIVEVDATYYAIPAERNAKAWIERTPPGFVFNAKAFSLLTRHPTRPAALPMDLREQLGEAASKPHVYPRDVPRAVAEECWTRYFDAMRPLADAGRLGAILFQFPEWFTPGQANREYILECKERLAKALPDAWCAVEFRNATWMADPDRRQRTLDFLREHMLPYVCVDMPQGFPSSIPPIVAITAALAVVRFHGRRAETWGKRGVTVHERFRYEYSRGELEEWTPRIDSLAAGATEVHVLMNNCYSDYSVRAAQTMARLLLDES